MKKFKRIVAMLLAAILLVGVMPAEKTEAALNSEFCEYAYMKYYKILGTLRVINTKYQSGFDASSAQSIVDFMQAAAYYDYRFSQYSSPNVNKFRIKSYNMTVNQYRELVSSYFFNYDSSKIEALIDPNGDGKVSFSIDMNYLDRSPSYTLSMVNIDYNMPNSTVTFLSWWDTTSIRISVTDTFVFHSDIDASGKWINCKIVSHTSESGISSDTHAVTGRLGKFTDVSSSSWFYDAVGTVFYASIMGGMNATTFGPAVTLSRAQFATMLYRMEGEPIVAFTNKFPDVKDGQFYSNAVIWASNKGIVTGYQNKNFGPADKLTREQLAVMLYRYAKYKGYEIDLYSAYGSMYTPTTDSLLGNYSDGNKVSGFAKNEMAWALNYGIITGKEKSGQSYLDPQGSASRAECATMISRFMMKYGFRW